MTQHDILIGFWLDWIIENKASRNELRPDHDDAETVTTPECRFAPIFDFLFFCCGRCAFESTMTMIDTVRNSKVHQQARSPDLLAARVAQQQAQGPEQRCLHKIYTPATQPQYEDFHTSLRLHSSWRLFTVEAAGQFHWHVPTAIDVLVVRSRRTLCCQSVIVSLSDA